MENGSQGASGTSQGSTSGNNENMVSYESHKKLLGEKKKLQESFNELSAKVELFEQKQLEDDGKKDEVIASLRKQLEEKTTETKQLKTNFAWNTIQGQIKSEAVAQGCKSPDKLIKLLSEEQIGGIEIDDNFAVNQDDLKRLVSDAKTEHQDIGLFGTVKVNVNDVPGKNERPEPKAKKLEEMTTEELEAELAKSEE